MSMKGSNRMACFPGFYQLLPQGISLSCRPQPGQTPPAGNMLPQLGHSSLSEDQGRFLLRGFWDEAGDSRRSARDSSSGSILNRASSRRARASFPCAGFLSPLCCSYHIRFSHAWGQLASWPLLPLTPGARPRANKHQKNLRGLGPLRPAAAGLQPNVSKRRRKKACISLKNTMLPGWTPSLPAAALRPGPTLTPATKNCNQRARMV